MSICKTCCKSTYGRGRAKKEKLYWLQQYGGKCQHCGIEVNENNYVIFDFHHTNPSEKENNPNNIYRYGREIVKKKSLEKNSVIEVLIIYTLLSFIFFLTNVIEFFLTFVEKFGNAFFHADAGLQLILKPCASVCFALLDF